jgi:hypothetical protein
LPRQEHGLFLWEPPAGVECDPGLADWLAQALELSPAERFANARDMLDALNALPLGRPSAAGVDLRAFEAYRSELIPMVVYPLLENLKQGHSHLYKSSVGGRPISVKVWYGRKPDPKRPEETHQLQMFLDKARLVKTQPCASLAEVIDFGISDAGTFLVQQWVEDQGLQEVAGACASGRQMLELCHQLVKATLHLHSLGLQHGDLHPGNVVLEGGVVRFIDAIDMVPGGGAAPYNPAYVPADHEAVALDQRDCYAVAKMCGELMDRREAWEACSPVMRRTAHPENRHFRPLRNCPPQRPRGGNAASGYALRSVPASHNRADNSFATTPDSSICCQQVVSEHLHGNTPSRPISLWPFSRLPVHQHRRGFGMWCEYESRVHPPASIRPEVRRWRLSPFFPCVGAGEGRCEGCRCARTAWQSMRRPF